MSKDWTPREFVIADMAVGLTKSKQVANLIVGGTAQKVVLYDPDCDMSRRYPWLSFLVNDFGTEFWTAAQRNSTFAARLSHVETYVQALVTATQERRALPEVPEVIRLWFRGELDPGFYYNETNTAIFVKWLCDYCSRWLKTRYVDASGRNILIGDIVRAKTTKRVKGLDISDVIESVVSIKRGEVVMMFEEYDDIPYPLRYCPKDSRHIMPETEALPYWTNRLNGIPPEYLYKRHWPQNIE